MKDNFRFWVRCCILALQQWNNFFHLEQRRPSIADTLIILSKIITEMFNSLYFK